MTLKSYHVNPITGNPGLCSARYECPFGDKETSHFDSPQKAREFFESTQSTFPSTKRVDRVFRIGSLDATEAHFSDLKNLIERFDSATPPGRQTRAGALFASPDLLSHMRWVKSFQFSKTRANSHELTVNPQEVFVYPIDIYEDASVAEGMGRDGEFEKLCKEYWDSGMTLSEWRVWAEKAKPGAGTWEVLLPPSAITKTKPVSSRRIIENAPEDMARELNWVLEPRRAAKGLLWRKEAPAD